MVRFARSDGSKGSNKRVLEEATPWSEMVSQMKRNDRQDNIEGISDERKNESIDKDKQEESPSIEDPPFLKTKKKRLGRDVPDTVKLVVENGQKFQVMENGKKRPWFDLPYEENDRMTQYEGFWMKCEMVKQLNELRETLKETMDSVAVKKKMMKAKRKAHKDLIRDLVYEQKDEFVKREAANLEKEGAKDTKIKDNNNEEKLDCVLFDGFWVTKEGAVRLKNLRADLLKKGVSKAQLRLTMKSERRKEEKALRREKKRVCLRCRKRGHLVSDCPEVGPDEAEQNCICYACGSTEHKLSQCTQAGDMEAFPHATCFICRRTGHISKQCPDNARGLYPNGGSCRGCGSVVHLAANCPVLQTQKDKATIRVGRIDGNAVESLEINDFEFSPAPKPGPRTFKKQMPKIIYFD